MKTIRALLILVALPFAGCTSGAHSTGEATDKDRAHAAAELADATQVLTDSSSTDQVPIEARLNARCVVVAPSLVNAGFIVGASHGSGVVTCRTSAGWSGPVFITLSGGSAGLQAGVQSSDLLMLVNTDRGVTRLFQSSFQLGADASVAAGPVGKGRTASTDTTSNAEMLTYARAQGVFLGVQLGGVSISQDLATASALYGPSPDIHAILSGAIPPPKEAAAFLAKIRLMFSANAS